VERNIYNEKLNDLYSSRNIIWVILFLKNKMGVALAGMGERRSAYSV
jgi:hypothetical protein